MAFGMAPSRRARLSSAPATPVHASCAGRIGNNLNCDPSACLDAARWSAPRPATASSDDRRVGRPRLKQRDCREVHQKGHAVSAQPFQVAALDARHRSTCSSASEARPRSGHRFRGARVLQRSTMARHNPTQTQRKRPTPSQRGGGRTAVASLACQRPGDWDSPALSQVDHR